MMAVRPAGGNEGVRSAILNGAARRGDETLHVMQTVLRGERIAFRAGDGRHGYAFSGHVAGDTMSGAVQIHGVEGTRLTTWQATRR